MQQGFLLLSASLVYSPGKVNTHAKHWRRFMTVILHQLVHVKPCLKLVLLGRIANQIPESGLFSTFKAEHPYNLSFITNPEVLDFFKPFNILSHEYYNRPN
jgi:uracil-DNA glycosylase